MKKKILAVAAVSALTAVSAVPAMALENEFHGMFKTFGFISNAYNGGAGNIFVTPSATVTPAAALTASDKTKSYAEQRARIQYIAKANDDLKLITHFELDSRFGGQVAGVTDVTKVGKYTGSGDAGQLDADSVSLETKQVYLDFNTPTTKANVKVGVQPWGDAYQSTFALFDGAGLLVSKKFDFGLTPTIGWFRINDVGSSGAFAGRGLGRNATDLIVVDGKFAVTKDLNVGASYYAVLNDSGAALATGSAGVAGQGFTTYELLHMIGLNAAAKFGPAAVNVWGAYQFGDVSEALDSEISAFGGGATAKVKAGPGNVNAAFLYLSGDDDGVGQNNDQDGWQVIAPNTTYFNPANMWLLVRNGQTINTSVGIGGNNLNKGGRGLIGAFGGYDLTMGKAFANANVGAAWAAETTGSEEAYLGTEVNGQVGYKMYENLSVSLVGAYLFLGDGANGTGDNTTAGTIIGSGTSAVIGTEGADDRYLAALQFAYTF